MPVRNQASRAYPTDNKRLVLLNLIALVAAFAYTFLTWHRLPEKYPAHYDLAGNVDRYAEADSLEWFVFPIIAVVLFLIMAGVVWLIGRVPPGLMNLPQKEKFVALSDEERAPIHTAIARVIWVMALLQTCACIALQDLLLQAALRGSKLVPIMVLIAIGVFFVAEIVRSTIQIRDMILEASKG